MINQFINTLKNQINFQNLIFFLFFTASFLLSLIIFLSLSGNLSNLEQVNEVSNLISTNYILILVLIFFSINKIYKVFVEKKKKSKFN